MRNAARTRQEFALLLVLVALAVMAASGTLADALANLYWGVADAIDCHGHRGGCGHHYRW